MAAINGGRNLKTGPTVRRIDLFSLLCVIKLPGQPPDKLSGLRLISPIQGQVPVELTKGLLVKILYILPGDICAPAATVALLAGGGLRTGGYSDTFWRPKGRVGATSA
jgi:hypothetical protein